LGEERKSLARDKTKYKKMAASLKQRVGELTKELEKAKSGGETGIKTFALKIHSKYNL